MCSLRGASYTPCSLSFVKNPGSSIIVLCRNDILILTSLPLTAIWKIRFRLATRARHLSDNLAIRPFELFGLLKCLSGRDILMREKRSLSHGTNRLLGVSCQSPGGSYNRELLRRVHWFYKHSSFGLLLTFYNLFDACTFNLWFASTVAVAFKQTVREKLDRNQLTPCCLPEK